MKSYLRKLCRSNTAPAILIIAFVCMLADRPAEGDSRRPLRRQGVIESHITSSRLWMLGNHLPDWVTGQERFKIDEEGEPTAFGSVDLSEMSYFVGAAGVLVYIRPQRAENVEDAVPMYFPTRYDENCRRPQPCESKGPLEDIDWDCPPPVLPEARFLFCFPEEVQVKAPVKVALSKNITKVWVDSRAFPGFYFAEAEVVRGEKGLSVLLAFRRLPESQKLTFYLEDVPERWNFQDFELWYKTKADHHSGGGFHKLLREPWEFSRRDSIEVSVDVVSSLLLPHPTQSDCWGDQKEYIAEELRVRDLPDSVTTRDAVYLKDIHSFRVAVYKSRDSTTQNDGAGAFVRWDYDTRRKDRYLYRLKSPERRIWPVITIERNVPPEFLAGRLWEVCAIPKRQESNTSEWQLIGAISVPDSLPNRMRIVPTPLKGGGALDPERYEHIGLRIAGNCPSFRGRIENMTAHISFSEFIGKQPVEVVSAIDHTPVSDVVVRPPAIGRPGGKAGALDIVFLLDWDGRKCWPAKPVTIGRPGFHDATFDPEKKGRVFLEPIDNTCEVQIWLGADSSGVSLAEDEVQLSFHRPLVGWDGSEPTGEVEHGVKITAPGGIGLDLWLSGTAGDRYKIDKDKLRGLKSTDNPERPYTWPLADSAQVGRVAIILAGRPVGSRIDYRFDSEWDEGFEPALEFQQLRAGEEATAAEIEFAEKSPGGGTVIVKDALTTTRALIVQMRGTPELEGIEPTVVDMMINADGELVASSGESLLVRRRRPGVVVLVDATKEMGAVWSDVRDVLSSVMEEGESLPLKLRIALAQDMNYESVSAVPENVALLQGYRVGPMSNPRPDQHMRRADDEVMALNSDASTVRNRIIYVIPNDPVLYRPWNPERSPFDETKVDLYVVEIGLPNSATPDPTPFAEAFFKSTSARDYAFVKSGDELRGTVFDFLERTE